MPILKHSDYLQICPTGGSGRPIRKNDASLCFRWYSRTLTHLAAVSHEDFPIVIIYAQQQETGPKDQGASTGWEAMLEAIIQARLGITGTWPIWGARSARMRSIGSNSLASYIVLVCRPQHSDLPIGSRREFITALRSEFPSALLDLQQASVAPVDLAQAAIGPGMAIFTRYSKILDAEGKEVKVHDALVLINEVRDEILGDQPADLDSDTRWALAWFEQTGFGEGAYGIAEALSKAKNNSVEGLDDARIVESKSGKVRLLRPSELPKEWEPERVALRAWAMVHHLIRALEAGGERAAAEFVTTLGAKAEVARELAYRLYTLCERTKRAQEALSYNSLVQSWPEIIRLAEKGSTPVPEQAKLI